MLRRGSCQSEEVRVGEMHQPTSEDDLKMMMMSDSKCCDLPSGYMGDCTGTMGMAMQDVGEEHQPSGEYGPMMMNDSNYEDYDQDNLADLSWF